jgi:hypothetical protein
MKMSIGRRSGICDPFRFQESSGVLELLEQNLFDAREDVHNVDVGSETGELS